VSEVSAAELIEQLRRANARLRDLLAARDAEIEALRLEIDDHTGTSARDPLFTRLSEATVGNAVRMCPGYLPALRSSLTALATLPEAVVDLSHGPGCRARL
jgi:hypothetical protein